MIYYKKIYLECEEEVRNFAISDIFKQNTDLKYQQFRHSIPKELEKKINQELNNYGIPNILYSVSYVRKQNTFQGIHIDGDNSGIISSAINIPLKGFNKSYHIWYQGEYNTKVVTTSNLTFHSLHWTSEPKESSRLKIDSPYLLRVDKPHSALAGPEDRWVFTMRFVGNPNFDELVNNGKF